MALLRLLTMPLVLLLLAPHPSHTRTPEISISPAALTMPLPFSPRTSDSKIPGMLFPSPIGSFETVADVQAAVKNFSVIIQDNGINEGGGNCSREGLYQSQQAAAFRAEARAQGKRVGTGVYRQGSIAITDFSDYTPTLLLTDPAYDGYWAEGDNGPFDNYNPCGKGKPCPQRGVIREEHVGCSGTANRSMTEWNFTNASAQALFLRMVSAIAADPAVDAVFFDDVDTSPVCAFPWAGPIWYDHATLTQLWDAMVDTYIKVGHILNAAGKVPIISSTNYFSDFEGGVMNGFPPAANASQVAKGWNPMGRTGFMPGGSPGADDGKAGCVHSEEVWVKAMRDANVSWVRFYEEYAGTCVASGAVRGCPPGGDASPLWPSPAPSPGPLAVQYIVDPRSCALDIQNMQREQEMGIPVLVRGEGGWALSARTKTPPIQGAKFEFDFHAAAWAVASSDTTPSWFTRYHFGYADVAFSWNPRFETVLGKSKAEMKALDGYSFSREFEHYTVIVNCTTQEGSFVKRR